MEDELGRKLMKDFFKFEVKDVCLGGDDYVEKEVNGTKNKK